MYVLATPTVIVVMLCFLYPLLTVDINGRTFIQFLTHSILKKIIQNWHTSCSFFLKAEVHSQNILFIPTILQSLSASKELVLCLFSYFFLFLLHFSPPCVNSHLGVNAQNHGARHISCNTVVGGAPSGELQPELGRDWFLMTSERKKATQGPQRNRTQQHNDVYRSTFIIIISKM